ncbi:MAG: hypothetical protein EOP49_36135 [Sphingobacteriales bacterium]|nr:MAG: hypothetical protein EOP49_36135 [Sphingobacteriales bacterium]
MRGGKRKGAGRHPAERKKKAVGGSLYPEDEMLLKEQFGSVTNALQFLVDETRLKTRKQQLEQMVGLLRDLTRLQNGA